MGRAFLFVFLFFFFPAPLPRIKHQFSALIISSRKPLPKAITLLPSPADLNLVSLLLSSNPPVCTPNTHEIKGFSNE